MTIHSNLIILKIVFFMIGKNVVRITSGDSVIVSDDSIQCDCIVILFSTGSHILCCKRIVGIAVLNGGTQPISEILHFENRIVYCIETYLIHF